MSALRYLVLAVPADLPPVVFPTDGKPVSKKDAQRIADGVRKSAPQTPSVHVVEVVASL